MSDAWAFLCQYDSHLHPGDSDDISFALPLAVSCNLKPQIALKQDIDFVCREIYFFFLVFQMIVFLRQR